MTAQDLLKGSLAGIELDLDRLRISRDQVLEALQKENIGTGLHYKAIHHHEYYRNTLAIPAGALPNADYASDRILSLPLFPKMTDEDARDVVTAVKDVIARNRK